MKWGRGTEWWVGWGARGGRRRAARQRSATRCGPAGRGTGREEVERDRAEGGWGGERGVAGTPCCAAKACTAMRDLRAAGHGARSAGRGRIEGAGARGGICLHRMLTGPGHGRKEGGGSEGGPARGRIGGWCRSGASPKGLHPQMGFIPKGPRGIGEGAGAPSPEALLLHPWGSPGGPHT